jgi:hypothetical protein
MTGRTVAFDEGELARIRECCQALGVAYVEFIHKATMDAVEELEGYARDEHAEIRRQERIHNARRRDREDPDAAPALGDPDRFGCQEDRDSIVGY